MTRKEARDKFLKLTLADGAIIIAFFVAAYLTSSSVMFIVGWALWGLTMSNIWKIEEIVNELEKE